MAEGASDKKEKSPEKVASEKDVAAAVEKAKTPKTPTVKLPENFITVIKEIGITLKDIKLVNANLEKALANLNSKQTTTDTSSGFKDFFKKLNKPEPTTKDATKEVEGRPATIFDKTILGLEKAFINLNKSILLFTDKGKEEDTGASVLKKKETQPVIVEEYGDKALRAQYEFYRKDPLPVKLAEIEDKIFVKLEKLFEKLGKGKSTSGDTGFFAGILNAVKSMGPALKALGAGLGKGFEFLGKGIGAGVAAIGKGFGSFLQGFSAGLGPLATGLATLANPATAIGLGLVVLAINGLALALRVAAPAIKEIIPLFTKIAEIIGGVLLKAIETIGDVLKTALKEIPAIIKAIGSGIATVFSEVVKAVGEAISTILNTAGPALFELTKIIGDVAVKIAKELGPVITALVPAFVEVVKVVKEGLITTLQFLSPIFGKVVDGVRELASILGNILVKAIEGISPVLQSLGVALEGIVNNIGKSIDAISTVLSKLIGLFDTGFTAVKDITVKFFDSVQNITDILGKTITNTITGIKDLIVDTLKTVVIGIKELSNIGFINMTKVAAGITEIALALGKFTLEVVKDGVRMFAMLGRPDGPLSVLSNLTDKADDLKTLSDNIISFSQTLNTVDIAAEKLDQLAAVFLKFNDINLDKLKEITQLPFEKITKAATLAAFAATTAVSPVAAANETTFAAEPATPTQQVEVQSPVITAKAGPVIEQPEIEREETAETVSIKAPTTEPVERQAPATEKANKLIAGLSEKPAAAAIQGQIKANTAPIIPINPAIQSVPELTIIAEKIEKLIKTLQPMLEQRNAVAQTIDSSSTNAAAVATNNSTTIYTNSVDRDIPFIERNKYREQFMYSRGLI